MRTDMLSYRMAVSLRVPLAISRMLSALGPGHTESRDLNEVIRHELRERNRVRLQQRLRALGFERPDRVFEARRLRVKPHYRCRYRKCGKSDGLPAQHVVLSRGTGRQSSQARKS